MPGLRIAFVHAPMATVAIPQRQAFWRNFDLQYHAAHPGLHHMRDPIWELPHWMHWLAGVAYAAGFEDIHAIDLWDCGVGLSEIDEGKTRSILGSQGADVFLFSPMTPNLAISLRIAEVIDEIFPQARVIFGGLVATPLKQYLASQPYVDYVISDRAEIALVELLKAIEGRTPVEEVRQLTWKDGGGHIASNALRYPSVSPSQIPFPIVGLFPESTGERLRYLRQVYALGCPYDCSFCTIQTIGRRPEYFPVDRVMSEIRAYRDYYGKDLNIYFGDETFTLNEERIVAFCEVLKEDGAIHYDCQTRINCLTNPAVLKALRDSGCRWIEIGLETANQDSQNIFKQRVQLKTVEKTLAQVRDMGLATCSFAVNGFPNQTLDDMKMSIDWFCSLISRDLLQASYFGGLVPYPGSGMYEQAERWGLSIRHHSFEFYNEELTPVFDSKYCRAESVYEVFLEGLRSFADAMNKKPCIGSLPLNEGSQEYGAFWAGSHI